MNCPRCSDALVQEMRAGTEVDRCPKCEGIWLDWGEGEPVTRPANVPEAVLNEAVADTVHDNPDGKVGPCPHCGAEMKAEKYDRSGVEIDRCRCGVWLDGGEMEKIAAYRQKRLDEMGDRFGKVDPTNLEKIYARSYFNSGK